MKTLTGLLPFAAVLVLVSALIWWLLERDSGAAPWFIAVVLFAHGWVHLVFLLPPGPDGAQVNPFDMTASWVVGRGTSVGLVHTVGTFLAILTFIALLAAALATLGWLVPSAWWAGCVVVGIIASTLMLVLFFAPVLMMGFFINAALLVLVAQSAYEVPR